MSKGGGEKVDKVVKEFDVFLASPIDSSTKLYLLQCPLRPPWRPYLIDDSLEKASGGDKPVRIQLKPQQGRVEMEIPMDQMSENYNAGASDHLHIQNISLKSQPAPLRTSHAVGIFTKSGELHLVPVNNAVQLRPSLQHLDKADAAKKEQAARKEAEDKGEVYQGEGGGDGDGPPTILQPIKVSVQRPETERQVEARLRRQREDEPWMPLQGWSSQSQAASMVMGKFIMPEGNTLQYDLGHKEYLKTLLTDISHAHPLDFNPGTSSRQQECGDGGAGAGAGGGKK